MAEMLSEEPAEMQWPVTVSGLEWGDGEVLIPHRRGNGASWVAVRPCDAELNGRTFLGFLLGDMALSVSVRYDRESGVMSISYGSHNPAIWVPDLGRIVYGCGSWWGEIKSAGDLRQITDADIDNIWYVRAMKDVAAHGAQ